MADPITDPEKLATQLLEKNKSLEANLDEVQKSLKSAAEKQEASDKLIKEFAEAQKSHDEAIKELKIEATKSEYRENPEGVTEKALRNFNADRGDEAVDVKGALDYTKAFEAVFTVKGARTARLKGLTDAQKALVPNIEKSLTSADGSGGALIPPAFAAQVEQFIRDRNDFIRYARVMRTNIGKVQRILNGTTSTAWTADDLNALAASDSAGTPKQHVQNVSVENLLARQDVSMSLMEDAGFSISEYLTEPVSMDMALELDEALISTGTGTNRPFALINDTNITSSLPAFSAATVDYLGHFKSNATGAFSTVASLNADSASDILAMIGEIQSGYRANGRFYMTPTTLAAVRALKGSDDQFIVRDQMSRNGMETMLFGKPVSLCESFPEITSTSGLCIAFGDMSRAYTVAMGRGMQMLTDRTSGFPATRYLFSMRCGGAPYDPASLLFLQTPQS